MRVIGDAPHCPGDEKCELPPAVMTRLLLSLLILLAAKLPTRAAEIPFEFSDGFITIQATVGDSAERLWFLVDSGAGTSVLSIDAARRLGVRLGAREMVSGVGSEAAARRLSGVRASAEGVDLGPLTLATDLHMADEICDRHIDGLVGIEFFHRRIVQIDYSARKLRLLDRAPEGVVDHLPLAERNGVACVPIGVNGSTPRLTRLDTGCNDGLHWVVPRREGRRGGKQVSIGFVTDPRDLSLTDVTVGGQTLAKVPTALHGRALFPGESGLLGNQILSRFLVTVDWPGGQLWLSPAERGSATE